MNDEHYMKKALLEAKRASDIGEVPVGAIVVIDKKIISRAHNQVELLTDCTAHAEMLALTSAFSSMGSKYLPEATLYVTLEPCLMCCGALAWSKIGRIVYGGKDDKNGFHRYFKQHPEEAKTVWHPKTKVSGGVLSNDCINLLKTFFAKRR